MSKWYACNPIGDAGIRLARVHEFATSSQTLVLTSGDLIFDVLRSGAETIGMRNRQNQCSTYVMFKSQPVHSSGLLSVHMDFYNRLCEDYNGHTK